VLRGALTAVAEGGAVFVGDVRNLLLNRCLQAELTLRTVGSGERTDRVRALVDRAVVMENELLVDPAFFDLFARTEADVAGLEVNLKPGRSTTELSRYRYDVTLYKAPT